MDDFYTMHQLYSTDVEVVFFEDSELEIISKFASYSSAIQSLKILKSACEIVLMFFLNATSSKK